MSLPKAFKWKLCRGECSGNVQDGRTAAAVASKPLLEFSVWEGTRRRQVWQLLFASVNDLGEHVAEQNQEGAHEHRVTVAQNWHRSRLQGKQLSLVKANWCIRVRVRCPYGQLCHMHTYRSWRASRTSGSCLGSTATVGSICSGVCRIGRRQCRRIWSGVCWAIRAA